MNFYRFYCICWIWFALKWFPLIDLLENTCRCPFSIFGDVVCGLRTMEPLVMF
jgi:hypothetical protein